MLTIISSLVIILIVFGMLIFALQSKEKHNGNTGYCGTCTTCNISGAKISNQSNDHDYCQER